MTDDNGRDERHDYLEYIDELDDKEQEFLKKFYDEFHFAKIPKKGGVLNSDDMKSQAQRNNNMNRTDVLFRSKKDGFLQDLDENAIAFLEEAHDEWSWENAFYQAETIDEGFIDAVALITQQAVRDIEAGQQIEIILLRYYEKRDRLRRTKRKEEKEHGKKA